MERFAAQGLHEPNVLRRSCFGSGEQAVSGLDRNDGKGLSGDLPEGCSESLGSKTIHSRYEDEGVNALGIPGGKLLRGVIWEAHESGGNAPVAEETREKSGVLVEVDDSKDRLSNERSRTRRSAEAEIAGRSDTDEESEAAAEAQFALDRNDAAH